MELQATPETREAMIEKALAQYNLADSAIAEMRAKSAGLKINGLDDKAGFAVVKEARLEFVRARGAVERKRVQLKADALEFGRRVDGEAKRLTALLLEGETPLETMENSVVAEKARIQREAQEKAERERKARLDARMAELAKYGNLHAPSVVEQMSDAEFAFNLTAAVQGFEAKKAADAKAAADRAALEAAEAAERAQQEAAQREARRIESERIAQERAAAEAQRQANEAAAARLAKERAEVERQRREVEAEKTKAAQAAESKRLAKEAKEREKAEAARIAALAPDAEQVRAYLETIRQVPIPQGTAFTSDVEGFMANTIRVIENLLPTAPRAEQ